MTKIIAFLIVIQFVCFNTYLQAQSILEFKVTQNPTLVANAGKDTAVTAGEKVRLGGVTPASGGYGSYTYSWTPITGLDTATKANPIAKIDSTITYTLTIKDQFCTSISQITVKANVITGLPDFALEADLRIFPNPNTGTFYITSKKGLDERSLVIEVFDVSGKRLYRKTVNGLNKLNEVVNIAKGTGAIYILRLKGVKLNITQKIVIY